ncbi:LamG domain-containing protein [Hamadaea sp. NPDC050747]|uniref:LamG domain-containing protein n=1 Tax=Hamadaea sp. NPDC050747 TaxID=3155789 RepID=UPI0033CFEDB2
MGHGRRVLAGALVCALIGVLLAVAVERPDGALVAESAVDTDVRPEALRWNSGGDGTKAVFRYRADGGYSGSVCATTPCPIRRTGGPVTVSVARPAPLRDFIYTSLDGVDDAIVGTSSLTTQTNWGFTVVAWIRSSTPGQSAKIFSNTESYRGFALTYDAGLLRGTYSFRPAGQSGGATAANRHTVYQPAGSPLRVDDGKWHQVAFAVTRMPRDGGGYQARARLYVDGVRVTDPADYLEFPTGDFTFWDSASVPAIGAEPDGGVAANSFFHGDVSGLVVYNYQVDHNVLALRPPYDGDSPYLGLPSYFDYLVAAESPATGTGGTWSYARRFTQSERDGRWADDVLAEQARVAMPLLNANYVPQGVTVSTDGATLFNFFYYSQASTDPAQQNPSDGLCEPVTCPPYAVTATDLATQKVTAIYHLYAAPGVPLPGTHAGGIAQIDGRLYLGVLGKDPAGVSLSRRVYRFTPQTATVKTPADSGNDLPPVLELVADGYDDWDPAGKYPYASVSALAYAPATRTMYALGYYENDSVNQDGPAANWIIELAVDPQSGAVRLAGPVHKIPTTSADATGHNQGMTPLSGPGGCFLLAHEVKTGITASGRSQLVRWCSGSGEWAVLATMPGVAENLAIGPDGLVWVSNENSARRMQKRSSGQWWDRFTPYVAAFALTDLG